jgi:hypothetical protein
MLDESFHKLHYKIFGSYKHKSFRSKNSTKLIESYSQIISDKVVSQFNLLDFEDIGNVVLSNETLAGYGEYNAELNMFLLKKILEKLRENLGIGYKIEEKILVTFREQASLLQSHYAYDYYYLSKKFKTFDSFIEYGLINHHDDIFGSLWNDEVIEFLSDIFGKENIVYIPYEVLLQNQKQFLIMTVVSLGLIPEYKIERYLNAERENVNSHYESRGNYLRDKSKLSKLTLIALPLKRLVPLIILKAVKTQFSFIFKKQQNISKGIINISKEHRNEIRQLYKASNTKTAKMLSIDLGALGYSVEEK